MPKLKTHSGAKKRFFITKNRKVRHKKAGLRHLLTGMPASRGRHLRKLGTLSGAEAKFVLERLLPYS